MFSLVLMLVYYYYCYHNCYFTHTSLLSTITTIAPTTTITATTITNPYTTPSTTTTTTTEANERKTYAKQATTTAVNSRFTSQTAPAYSNTNHPQYRKPTTRVGGTITRRTDQPTRRVQPGKSSFFDFYILWCTVYMFVYNLIILIYHNQL